MATGSARVRVVFTIRSEDVQNLGVLSCGCLVFNVARNQKAVPRQRLEGTAGMGEAEMAVDDIHHLLLRMAMPGTNPTLLHRVPDEHYVGTIGQDLPPQPRLRI